MSKYKPVFFDIETTGFNPTIPRWYSNEIPSEITGVAIGTIEDWTDDGEVRSLATHMNNGNGEYELIEGVRNELKKIQNNYKSRGWEPFLVGHNIIQFDCLYWAARASRYRQSPYPISHGWRRLDTMRALSLPHDAKGGPKSYPGQQDYADYLGLDYVDELDGSQMPQAFVDGNIEDIKRHVKDDVATLMDIFMEEREDMVDYFWDHYDSNHDAALDEEKPSFVETVNIPTRDGDEE